MVSVEFKLPAQNISSEICFDGFSTQHEKYLSGQVFAQKV